MSQTHEINFKGARILGVKEDGKVFVPITPICDGMGIDASGQIERIKRDPVLAKGARNIRVPSGRGLQEMFCLPLQRIHYWLAGISTGSIKNDEIRTRVIEFKEECADVLFAYFMPELAQAIGIRFPTLEARLLQDDLFDRGPPAQPIDSDTLAAKIAEALIAKGFATRDDLRRVEDVVRSEVRPIKTKLDDMELPLLQAAYGRDATCVKREAAKAPGSSEPRRPATYTDPETGEVRVIPSLAEPRKA